MSQFLSQLCAEPWAMDEKSLRAFSAQLAKLTAEDVARARASGELGAAPSPPPYQVLGSVALVSVAGTLMRDVPSWYRYFGIQATSMSSIVAAVSVAAKDPKVSSILMRFNSPGGEAQGIGEVGDAIRAAAKKKPVVASVESMASSGAYWLAAQCSRISAAPDAMVGSIGCYFVFEDSSKAAEAAGVKVHVIRSGEHKGMGLPGDPITDAHVRAVQQLADGLADLFMDAVAKGRKQPKDTVRALATGQVWLAADAKAQGLIDDVEAAGSAVARVVKEARVADEEMAKARAEAAAGERKRSAELRAAFPLHPEFAAEQFELGATLAEAKAAYADVLAEELVESRAAAAAAQDELAQARTAAAPPPPTRAKAPAAAKPAPRGTDPAVADEHGEQAFDFMAASRAYAKEHGCKITEAMRKVAAQDPRAHYEWVQSQPKVRRDGNRYDRISRNHRDPASK